MRATLDHYTQLASTGQLCEDVAPATASVDCKARLTSWPAMKKLHVSCGQQSDLKKVFLHPVIANPPVPPRAAPLHPHRPGHSRQESPECGRHRA